MSWSRQKSRARALLWAGVGVVVTAAAGAAVLIAALGGGLSGSSGRSAMRGDFNCDGVIDWQDINAFVLAVNDPAGWCERHRHDLSYLREVGDFNADDAVNLRDIDGFAEFFSAQLGLAERPKLRTAATRTMQGPVDLDIDSDNNNGTGSPARDPNEDAIEDDPYLPGKEIALGSGAYRAVLEFEATGQTPLTDLTFRLTFPDEVSVAEPNFYDANCPSNGQTLSSGTTYSYPYCTTWVLGDMNHDGIINNFDLNPFILALTNKTSYKTTWGMDPDVVGDMNGDWTLNNFDTNGFVALLANPTSSPIPVRLLVTGVSPSAAQGETRLVADADIDGDTEFDPEDETDAVRATAYDSSVGLPPFAGLGVPPPWGAGLPVATYSTVNLRTGNLITQIPIDSWPCFGPDMTFRLVHNSGAANTTVPSGNGFALGPGWSLRYGGCLLFQPDAYNPTSITVVEDDGRLTTFTRDGDDWLPPTGVYDTLAAGTISPLPPSPPEIDGDPPIPSGAWVLTRKNQWRRVYDAQGRLIYDTDSARQYSLAIRVTRYADNDPDETLRGKVFNMRDSTTCRRLHFVYDEQGRLESIQELFVVGREWWFTYDGSNRVASIEFRPQNGSGESSAFMSFTYDGSGRLATIEDQEANTFAYTYDALGRLMTVTDPSPFSSQTQVFTYTCLSDPPRYQVIAQDRREHDWTCDFSLAGTLLQVTNPLNESIEGVYDEDHNLASLTNELQHTWNGTYDDRGNLLTVTDPLGHKWQAEYDEYNNMTSLTPPLNDQGDLDTTKRVELEYQDYYDEENELAADYTHPTKFIEPAADGGQGSEPAETALQFYQGTYYAPQGQSWRVTDANGVQSEFEYNGHGGELTRWTEGPSDGLRDGYPVEQQYSPDGAGRNTSSAGYNGGGTASYNFNNVPTTGSCSSSCTQGCRCVPAFQDGPEDPPDAHVPIADCSRLLPIPLCGYPCSVAQYDKLGHLLSSEMSINRISAVTDWPHYPYGRAFTWEPSSRSHTNTYDELYRLRETSLSTTEPTWNTTGDPVVRTFAFTPDANGNVVTMVDPEDVTTTYAYDDADRLTSVIVGQTTQVTYTLYANGRVHYADYANGTQVEWLYDAAQRLDQIIHRYGQTQLLMLDYTFTADGLVSSIAQTDASGTYTVSFGYDRRGRLIREYGQLPPVVSQGQPIAYDLAYTYDQVGNRKTKTDNAADPNVVTTYAYDTDSGAPEYGSHNNRLMYYEVHEQTSPPTLIEKTWYAYNLGGQVKRIVSQYPTSQTPGVYHVRAMQYTVGQQMWLIRGYTCEADPQCESGAQCEPVNVVSLYAREFRYDGDRRRYAVRELDVSASPPTYAPLSTSWHEYVGDDIYKDLEIDPQTGGVTVAATYAQGYTLAATTNSSGQRFFHADMLGTTRFLSDSSGGMVNRQGYSAFGELLGTGSESDFPRYGYAGSWGYQNDGLADAGQDIGMLHVGARYYDPAIGRFVQRDPIGVAGGVNTYAYATNSPVAYVDPTGLLSLTGTAVAGTEGVAIWVRLAIPVIRAMPYVTSALATGWTVWGMIRTPSRGEPNSSEVYGDWDDGTIRKFGPDGDADDDYDTGHHKDMGQFHKHKWYHDPITGKLRRGPPTPCSGNETW